MTAIHLHLILNHIPIIGTAGAIILLAYAIMFKKEDIRKAAFGSFILVALITPAVFFSGDNSVDGVKKIVGVSEASIEAHDEAAEIALASILGLGFLALLQLVLYRFQILERRRKQGALVTLSLAILTCLWAAYTANLGGKIRHGDELGKASISDIEGKQ